jgi:hypothetical protein
VIGRATLKWLVRQGVCRCGAGTPKVRREKTWLKRQSFGDLVDLAGRCGLDPSPASHWFSEQAARRTKSECDRGRPGRAEGVGGYAAVIQHHAQRAGSGLGEFLRWQGTRGEHSCLLEPRLRASGSAVLRAFGPHRTVLLIDCTALVGDGRGLTS